MTGTAGSTRWDAAPAASHLPPLLVAECHNLSTLLGEAQMRADTEATELALTALLATLED